MYGSGLGVLPTTGKQSGPGSGVSITGREVFLGFANSPAEEQSLFNSILTKENNEDLFVFWGVLENPGDMQYNFKRFYFAPGAGTYNPIPNVIGDDLLFISKWYPNAGTVVAFENAVNTVTINLGDITGEKFYNILNENEYDWSDDTLTYLVLFQDSEEVFLMNFIGNHQVYDGSFNETDFLRVLPIPNPQFFEPPTPPLQDVVNVSEVADKINLTENMTFGFGTGFNNIVNKVIEIGNKQLHVGNFTQYNGASHNRIVMLNADGTVFTEFNTGTGFNVAVKDVVYANGIIYCLGSFTLYNGESKNNIVALNLDGTINNDFVTGSGFNNSLECISFHNDKLYIGGYFSSYNSFSSNLVISLNLDGSINNSFVSGFPLGAVTAIKIFNNKIFCVGAFGTYNLETKRCIVSLNLDGTINNDFNVGVGFDAAAFIHDIDKDEFDRIYVGGNQATYKGNNVQKLIRLLPNGNIDPTFTYALNADVFKIIYTNNKIFIVSFGISTGIQKLNINGTVDFQTNFGSGFGSFLQNFTLLKNNFIICTGSFTTYKGITENYAVIIDQNGNKVTNYPASKLTFYNGRAQYFVDDFDQLEEYELVPKKLIIDLLPKRAIFRVNNQDSEGLNLTETSNNIGTVFQFNRFAEGAFEVVNFDSTIFLLICFPYQSESFCFWSNEDSLFLTQQATTGGMLPSDFVMEFGGLIIIEKY